jgi:hypothetical protein
MERRISKVLGLAMMVIAVVYGIVGAFPLAYRFWVHNNWNATEAVVSTN